MTTLLTPALIERCHAGSKAKGFWDVRPDPRQQLMLVISELAEALEGHRKNLEASLTEFEIWAATDPQADPALRQEAFVKSFLENIKDTPADELADAYIRLCDFIGGFGLDQAIIIEGVTADRAQGMEPMLYGHNFASNLLHVTSCVVAIADAPNQDDGSDYPFAEIPTRLALVRLEEVCEWQGIDLATHIDLKLRYNSTRPARHGKAY